MIYHRFLEYVQVLKPGLVNNYVTVPLIPVFLFIAYLLQHGYNISSSGSIVTDIV